MLIRASVFVFAMATCGGADIDPFLGTWTVNQTKSVLEGLAQSLPMNLSANYSLDDRGNLQIRMTAFGNGQTVLTETVDNYRECSGTERPLKFRVPPVNIWPDLARFPGSTFSLTCNKVGSQDRVLDAVVRSQGRLIASSRRSISRADGLLFEVKTGITPSGEYYRSLLVWERK